jgi:hypothetical protein
MTILGSNNLLRTLSGEKAFGTILCQRLNISNLSIMADPVGFAREKEARPHGESERCDEGGVKGGDCLAKWTGLGVGPVRRWRRVREAVGEVGKEFGGGKEVEPWRCEEAGGGMRR